MMSYAFCDWTLILARPGPQWMVEMETKGREERKFLIFSSSYNQSKSFNLLAEIIRQVRS
jgi:hypothetical protein